VVSGCARFELPHSRIRVVECVRGNVHVDEQREQWRDRRTHRVDLLEGALKRVLCERRLAPSKLDGGQRARRVNLAGETIEQLLGFLETPLADAQIGEPSQRTTAERAVTETP
jgi:hypothetical protein